MKSHEAVLGFSGEQIINTADFILKAIPWVVGILGVAVAFLAIAGSIHPKFKLPPQ